MVLFLIPFLLLATAVWAMPNPAALECENLGGQYLLPQEECIFPFGHFRCPAWDLVIDRSCAGHQVCEKESDCPAGEYCRRPGCFAKGICMPKPQVCIELYAPVCGCDGNTYSNSCFAAANGVTVAYQGSCLPGGIKLKLEVNGNLVSAEWEAVFEVTHYVLFYAPYPQMEPIGSLEMGQKTRFSISLPPGSAYYVAIGGYDTRGRLHLSPIKYFILPTPWVFP